MPAKITNSESVEQITLFRWAAFMETNIRSLSLCSMSRTEVRGIS